MCVSSCKASRRRVCTLQGSAIRGHQFAEQAGGREHKFDPALLLSGLTRQFSTFTRNEAGLPVVWHPAYSAPLLPSSHRFPMKIFQTIYDRLLETKVVRPEQVHIPVELPSMEQMSLVHDPEYVREFCEGTLSAASLRRIGLPWSPVLVTRTLAEVAGTLLTAELALEYGLACNTAGGTHHAFRDFGSGFCIINDLAVTSAVLLERGAVSRVLIVDLDVHQGDGTAAILAHEPRVFTMSVHAASNFPAKKQRSDLDVPLPDGLADEEYLAVVADHLPRVLTDFRPDLVLYDAGVDPHKDDSLGRLSLTDAGLFQRERMVFDTCLAFGVPVAAYVGGGYSTDLDVLAARHCFLHQAATEVYAHHHF
ncbi:histone deacetylase [Klebsormidium nitens]|uniref:Histone deacetylase n=1 Tax=Klebsormidium nitens TaxID=105231 RepID=A0A1Y1I7W1_KLENI|nr:histone deacetylase [Klebsormidium nitens]|eukprot:GAQ87064.1 histone deacetylase [Klebsormidium nitens]